MREFVIPRDRAGLPNPISWNIECHTSKDLELLYGKRFAEAWILFENGNNTALFLKEEWDDFSRTVAERFLYREGFYAYIVRELYQREKKLTQFLSHMPKNPIELATQEILELMQGIKEQWLSYDYVNNILIWSGAGDVIHTEMKQRLDISENDLDLLTTPRKPYWHQSLDMDIFKFSQGGEESSSSSTFNKTMQRYAPMPYGYDGPVLWDEVYFRTLLSKVRVGTHSDPVKAHTQKMLDKRTKLQSLNLTPLQQQYIQTATLFNEMADTRKQCEFPLHSAYGELLRIVSHRCGVPHELSRFITHEELWDLALHTKKLIALAEKRKNQKMVAYARNGFLEVLAGERKSVLLEDLSQQKGREKENTSTVRGMCVSTGTKNVYRGVVRVVFHAHDVATMAPGEFLVTGMTSPEFTTLMQQAVGIITDEGGITCHAAIIARELKKPCIIGTKIATRVLKDGDLVEVDAILGKVTILEK